MENRSTIFRILIFALFFQSYAHAQTASKFLDAGIINTASKTLTELKRGDTLKIERIHDKAQPGDLIFEKGTIQLYTTESNQREVIGTWSASKNGQIIFITNKTYYLRPIIIKENGLQLLMFKTTD